MPEGSFINTPGQIATCPKGTYKDGTGLETRCKICGAGITTAAEGATSRNDCKVLVPKYMAIELESGYILRTRLCPQNFYCSGGSAIVAFNAANATTFGTNMSGAVLCPDGLWTQKPGASSPNVCRECSTLITQ